MTSISKTVGFRLAHVCRHHRNRAAALLAPLGLHAGQDLILIQLWMEDGVTQSCLADRVGIDVSTMTKALQRLERYGLVHRSHDAEDTRAVRVFLTEQGRALEPAVTEVLQQVEERSFAGLTEDERAFLERLLFRIEQNLR